MSARRWRIRRCSGLVYPWVVSHPARSTVQCFPTYDEARRYVLTESRETVIARQVDELRRLTPRRPA